jgi:RNA polymerase sigma-70 factor, ECF subfamily
MPTQDPGDDDELRLRLLVLRCQAGDEHAFAQLFDRFGPRSLAMLQRLVGDAAEDVQQEVWLAVYRHIGTLSNLAGFRSWLYATTRHRAIDQLRSARRQRGLIADAVLDSADVTESEEQSGVPLVDPAALDGAIASLPDAQRDAVVLRYRNGLSYAEVAAALGCSVGTVRSRLHYARQRLYELLRHRR